MADGLSSSSSCRSGAWLLGAQIDERARLMATGIRPQHRLDAFRTSAALSANKSSTEHLRDVQCMPRSPAPWVRECYRSTMLWPNVAASTPAPLLPEQSISAAL